MIVGKAIDWLKANYDRAVLIATAVFLFISAVAIWWSAIQFGNELIAPGRVPPKTASQPPVAAELDRAAEQLQKPFQWKSSNRSGTFLRRAQKKNSALTTSTRANRHSS